MWEEIVCGGEEGEGEDGRLVGGEGEVCEGKGGMDREEEGAVVVVVVGEGRCVDGASGGEDCGSKKCFFVIKNAQSTRGITPRKLIHK
ncbi:uncharacterized protein MONOS_17353 [Monocercomonoides exilis]|uniref:uncharacterized protein n=1 Tax=Monocercomonoides exilis TaxID=2049356 RepID=UPI00355A3FD6|nr:hypothetical protein MONOS_17353 [Monocercomonoides exilis]